MRILVIEDEQKVANALKEGLTHEGYRVDVALSGEEGFYLLSTQTYDLLLLDLMLPGRDGLEILKTIRNKGMHFPVLILTARDTVQDRVQGLDAGADDYLIKPFAFPELLARIRVLLRRGRDEHTLRLTLADLEMDLITRKVTRGETEIMLTSREFDLLEYLLRHREQVVSREMLARDVWQETNRATPIDNLIDVHIARLRRKIDDPFDRKLIHTIRGVGFSLSEENG
ncbi:MAG TPA: response regulator transcription factor [Caldithrix abyssi]|uniref:Response regulator transcription factor n=1 Tax=Caldithrix abyssi TaxID=187145 RepID=A0A7V5PM13_CALAY|nr:response regulator transcription factor [Caldithrix abyssi]